MSEQWTHFLVMKASMSQIKLPGLSFKTNKTYKGPFIFYEVGGAGGILLSVIKKLHDPPQ